jgi:hypothetical protein
MKVYIVLLVIVAIPIVLLVWRRHGHEGMSGTDPLAHKNIGVAGPPNENRTVGGPGGGPA